MQHSSYQLLTVPFESKRRYQGEGMHINTVRIYFMQKGPTAKQNCQNTTPIRRQSVSSPTYNLS